MARAAPQVVTEVLDVLIANAHRHGKGAVTVTVRALEGWLAIDVGDEGTGFAGDPVSAFERGAGSGEGHGIGLALARSLALAEGGTLEVTRAGPRPVLSLRLPQREPEGLGTRTPSVRGDRSPPHDGGPAEAGPP